MKMGSKRLNNKNYCGFIYEPTNRKWIKKRTIRLERLEGKKDVADRVDDFQYGFDPD